MAHSQPWTHPAGRPKQARSQQTLARLLDAAEALISDRGIASVSVADVVEAARSSVGELLRPVPRQGRDASRAPPPEAERRAGGDRARGRRRRGHDEAAARAGGGGDDPPGRLLRRRPTPHRRLRRARRVPPLRLGRRDRVPP
ncbi:MAG: helix-turn-helix transcriptional regulator [Deltaproteobacteria bacterium]|nr:helix-turn-helix transcriptional regulator [Deltaproteobacteria bacterium]